MIDKNNYCVIMAGGVGSRFWPLSTPDHPKQFVDVLGVGKSFIRQTYERFLDIVPVENFLVLTNNIYKDLVLREIPELSPNQILCEPCRRNTAPCILYAANRIAAINPNANMVITPSDHLVTGEQVFVRIISDGLNFVSGSDSLLTVGIKPTRPETGYGYIQVQGFGDGIVKVKTFTEKPSLELAKTFVECGEFLWNSGIFIWSVKAILDAFEKYQEDLFNTFNEGKEFYNTDKEQEFVNNAFPKCPNISIDYGIMEFSDNVFVSKADFGWSDIGTWGSLFENSEKDKGLNSITGERTNCYDVENSIIRIGNEKVAIIEGLKDYIVVDSDKALLICSKGSEQKIRYFIEDIK